DARDLGRGAGAVAVGRARAGRAGRDGGVAGLRGIDGAVPARRRAVVVVHGRIRVCGGALRAAAVPRPADRQDLLVRAGRRAIAAGERVGRAGDVVVARLGTGARIACGDRGVAGLADIDAAVAADRAVRRHSAVVVAD